MKLPYKEKAYIPLEKLTKYLLSEFHPVGRSNAKFFRKYGFDETNTHILEQELLLIVQTNEVTETVNLLYGRNYVVNGTIKTPRGMTITLVTVWFIETGSREPRFVTAYPV